MTARKEPEEKVKYRVTVGRSVRRNGGDAEIFKVQYDNKKPSTMNEAMPGRLEVAQSKATFEYESNQGGKMRLSGKVVESREYVLIFEGDGFRLERTTKSIASTRPETIRNAGLNHHVSPPQNRPSSPLARAVTTPTRAEPSPAPPESPVAATPVAATPVEEPVRSPARTPQNESPTMADDSPTMADDSHPEEGPDEVESPAAASTPPGGNATEGQIASKTVSTSKNKVPRFVVSAGAAPGAKPTSRKTVKAPKGDGGSSSSSSESGSSSSDSTGSGSSSEEGSSSSSG